MSDDNGDDDNDDDDQNGEGCGSKNLLSETVVGTRFMYAAVREPWLMDLTV